MHIPVLSRKELKAMDMGDLEDIFVLIRDLPLPNDGTHKLYRSAIRFLCGFDSDPTDGVTDEMLTAAYDAILTWKRIIDE